MSRLVAHINEHVFFWPGFATGPIESGLNHFELYRGEELAFLRILSADVINSSQALFCRFNSGAPRVVNGRRSPRGADTYVPASSFRGTAGDVVEVVVRGALVLPQSTQVAGSYGGPWGLLFGPAG